MTYAEKGDKLQEVKEYTDRRLSNLHPEDRAAAHRELGKWHDDRAKAQDEANTRDGIPDRDSPKEIEEDHFP